MKKFFFKKKKNKKKKNPQKKIVAIFIAINVLTLSITLPLLLSKKSSSNIDQIKFDNLKSKIEKYDFSKTITLIEEIDVDVSKNKNKIKNIIINEIEKKDNKLSQEEKNSIKIVNPPEKITNEFKIISIEIQFNKNKKIYDFYFARKAINKKESIQQKISKTLIDGKVIILSNTNNLFLSSLEDRKKVKDGIIKAINIKNKNNKLTKEEENSIIISNLDGIIKHDTILLVEITSSLIPGSIFKSLFSFKILRTPSNNSEKIDSLQAKLNNVDKRELILIPKSSYTFKTNDSNSLSYIKNLIFEHINKYNISNNLNKEEKNSFVFDKFESVKIEFQSDIHYINIFFYFKIIPLSKLSFGFVLKRN